MEEAGIAQTPIGVCADSALLVRLGGTLAQEGDQRLRGAQ